MFTGKVIVSLRGLSRFRKAVATDSPAIRRILTKWGVRFRSAMQQRFVVFSRGGGDWPKLKHKRKRGKLESAAILRDTGLMFQALSPVFQSLPGQAENQRPGRFETEVGYGGPGKYTGRGSSASLADIASFHHVGAGFLPVRKVVDRPQASAISAMAKDAETELGREAKRETDAG